MEKQTEILYKKCLKGDRGAQLTFYSRYARFIYASVIRIILSPEDAEEVMQDSFIKISSNLNKFNCEDDDAAFRAWMKQISVRTAIDSLRKKESLPEMFNEFDFDGLKDDEEAVYESLDTVDKRKESVMRLSGNYRIILSL